jgi:hypothetical protein
MDDPLVDKRYVFADRQRFRQNTLDAFARDIALTLFTVRECLRAARVTLEVSLEPPWAAFEVWLEADAIVTDEDRARVDARLEAFFDRQREDVRIAGCSHRTFAWAWLVSSAGVPVDLGSPGSVIGGAWLDGVRRGKYHAALVAPQFAMTTEEFCAVFDLELPTGPPVLRPMFLDEF